MAPARTRPAHYSAIWLRGLRLSILPARYKNIAQNTSCFLVIFVRAGRIELPSSDWQPDVLPLNYARVCFICNRLHMKHLLNPRNYLTRYVYTERVKRVEVCTYQDSVTARASHGRDPTSRR